MRTLLALLALTLVALTFKPTSARCQGFCPSFDCWASSVCSPCVCVSGGAGKPGSCQQAQ
jgi:hypothetical protein